MDEPPMGEDLARLIQEPCQRVLALQPHPLHVRLNLRG